MDGQIDIYEMMYPSFKFSKKIRLIELFGGVGAQAKALERLGVDFEHYRLSEWEVHSCSSYHKIHMKDDHEDYSKEFTDQELVDKLCDIGISINGKDPMTRAKIKAKSEKWHRKVFNDFMATHNIGSVMNVHGNDLGIVDKEHYQYILCYSFPCQDLSLAGKRRGMAKGGGTRSGLLWEVERLLTESDELPDVLLMENVPQVHGEENRPHFAEWISYLESIGYQNYYQDLNSKNYGVAQSRDRCFMVSILGNYSYKFPKRIRLKHCTMDYLEDEVDEKYYNNTEKARALIKELEENGTIKDEERITCDGSYTNTRKKTIANCITTREGAGIKNFQGPGTQVVEKIIRLGQMDNSDGTFETSNRVHDIGGVCPTITTRESPKVVVNGRNQTEQ